MTPCRFECPSCQHKFAAVEVGTAATAVATRTCRHCGERYRLIARFVREGEVAGEPALIHAATLTFLDNGYTRRRAGRPVPTYPADEQ